jgi:hypothetical protein
MQEPFEDDEKSEEDIENLRLENEIKKIKLSLEHGTDLSGQLSDAELPPEVEGKFLDYIQQFEDEFAKRRTILVYDLAGRPECRPEAEIPEDEISAELKTVLNILHINSISITTICDVPERELYRFITEELFNVETNDIRIPGMSHGFIYEEFHPNHEHDIKNRVTELVEYLFDKEKENATDLWELADEVETGDKVFPKKDLIEKLAHFRDAFSSFTVHDFSINVITASDADDNGEAHCTIHYSADIEGSAETMDFEGESAFCLKRQYEWWMITKFEIPGVVV